MENNIITTKLVEGIYDIQPPATPGNSMLEQLLLFAPAAFIAVICIYITWKLFFSSKAGISRQVKKLELKLATNKISTHQAVYELCRLLRAGLKISYIGREISLPAKLTSRKEDWQQFADTLSLLRHAKREHHETEMQELFNQSLVWLKDWP